MSPPLFRNYTVDIPLCLEVDRRRKENINKLKIKNEEIIKTKEFGQRRISNMWNAEQPVTTTTYIELDEIPDDNYLNKRILEKIQNNKANLEDLHDLKTQGKRLNNIQVRRASRLVNSCIYADDSSTRIPYKDKKELRLKIPECIEPMFETMRNSRLLVNAEKTSMICFMNTKRRNYDVGKDKSYEVEIEGHKVVEDIDTKLLGVWFERNYNFSTHVSKLKNNIKDILANWWTVVDMLTPRQRKTMAEAKLLSMLYYGVEIVSQTNDTVIGELKSILGKILKWTVNYKGTWENWSRSEKLKEVKWEDYETTCMFRSLISARTVILTGQSVKLKDMLLEDGKLKNYECATESKHGRKSWRVRATLGWRLLGREIMNPEGTKLQVKKALKKLTQTKKDQLREIFYGRFNEELPSLWI